MNTFNPLPPVTKDAVDWFKENLNLNMTLFEYGSGTSTLFFCQKVKKLIFIEYLPNRFQQTIDGLNHFKKMTISQAEVIPELIEAQMDSAPYPYSYESYGTTDQTYFYHHFKKNVQSIRKYKDLDIVFIGGRSRSACIKEAVKKIKKGGYLILNNSLRPEYQNAIDVFLNDYPRKSFTEEDNQTSVWTIK